MFVKLIKSTLLCCRPFLDAAPGVVLSFCGFVDFSKRLLMWSFILLFVLVFVFSPVFAL